MLGRVATGEIGELYIDENGFSISLRTNGPPTEVDIETYFRVERNFGNYAAIYSIALVAFVQKFRIEVITREEIIDLTNARYTVLRLEADRRTAGPNL